ncbi:MAG TPA: hypothetical protein PLR25_15480 [Planctomycetaceae bacterium]|nr:hypothetical protein [Planctomycetaceae bacterium]
MSSLKHEPTRTEGPAAPVIPVVAEVSKLVGAYRPDAWAFHRLPSREIKRRFWHMFPGMMAFSLHLVPHVDPISPLLRLSLVSFGIAVSIRILLGFRLIQRKGEGAGVDAVAGYAFSVLATILIFPRHLELGLAVLGILAFGDGAATFVGLTLRGPRLAWNRGKSWSGLIGFIVIGSLMTSLLYWDEARNPQAADPAVSFGLAFLLTAPAVVAAAFAESVRSRINDNIRVGIVAVVAIVLLHNFRPL